VDLRQSSDIKQPTSSKGKKKKKNNSKSKEGIVTVNEHEKCNGQKIIDQEIDFGSNLTLPTAEELILKVSRLILTWHSI
jgi:hypothetical protein